MVRSALLASLLCLGAAQAVAQVRVSGYELPAALAIEAATAALNACDANGYRVSVAVVNQSGETLVAIKGDHSAVHTKDSSFRKAYTQVSLGPIAGFDTMLAYVEKARGNPAAAALATLPNVILLPGAVAVKVKGEIVAAIGVGGAPGGEKDEACATAGLAAIAERLPH